MSLNYRLVRRPDMRKDAAEGSKLYYAQVRSLKKLNSKSSATWWQCAAPPSREM